MHFPQNFSSFFVGSLLATTALGSLIKAPRQPGPKLSLRDEWYDGIGNLEELASICGSSSAKRTIVQRAPPAGYTDVPVGELRTARDGQLWTEDLVSCTGIAIVGDQGDGAKDNQILAHLIPGPTAGDIGNQWNAIAAEIRDLELGNTRVYVAVADTGNLAASDAAKESLEALLDGLMSALRDETEVEPKFANHADRGTMQINSDSSVMVDGNAI